MNLYNKEEMLTNLKHERTKIILNDSYAVGLDGDLSKAGLVDFLSNSKQPDGFYNYFQCFTICGDAYDLYLTHYNRNADGTCVRDSIGAIWYGDNASNIQITRLYFVTTDVAVKIRKLNRKINRLEISLL